MAFLQLCYIVGTFYGKFGTFCGQADHILALGVEDGDGLILPDGNIPDMYAVTHQNDAKISLFQRGGYVDSQLFALCGDFVRIADAGELLYTHLHSLVAGCERRTKTRRGDVVCEYFVVGNRAQVGVISVPVFDMAAACHQHQQDEECQNQGGDQKELWRSGWYISAA